MIRRIDWGATVNPGTLSGHWIGVTGWTAEIPGVNGGFSPVGRCGRKRFHDLIEVINGYVLLKQTHAENERNHQVKTEEVANFRCCNTTVISAS